VLLVILLASLALVTSWGLTRDVRKHPDAVPAPVAVPAALARLGAPASGAEAVTGAKTGSGTGTEPRAAAVAAAIRPYLHASAIGPRLRARVVDAATGDVLFDDSGSAPAAPASTAKLMTAAAVLTVHAPTDRFRTRVALAPGGTVVLIGGGDPTLTAAATGHAGAYPDAARLATLAADVRAQHVHVTRVVVDDALFAGPSTSPAWAPEDVPSSYASGITAFLADGGRAAPSDDIRSATPDLDAAREFAALLGDRGLPVARGARPAGAKVVGTVSSAPLTELIEQMLQTSDNVIAEVLARQVAVAEHDPATFTGAARAIRDVLGRLHIAVGGGMVDGSGLAAGDRVAPSTLVALLRLVAGQTGPASAAQLRTIVAELPVSGWSGTLAYRYATGAARSAAGVVRAKTGSLTGVTSLAGYVHDSSGRLLIFSLDADRTPGSTAAAEAALDRIVTALAGCGCS